MARPGGYGAEPYGDPMGGGGPLQVVRAQAVAGQVVRVVFDEEPVHASGVGLNDAINPSNYSFAILTGTGLTPQAVGVDRGMIVGPTTAVQAGDERGFDVHTDRQLASGMNYRVQVALSVQSALGGALAGPGTADFAGIERRTTRPRRRPVELVDWRNDPIDGHFALDASRDVATESGLDGFKKRVIRRLTTVKNAFSFLPGYGVGQRLKTPAKIAVLQDYKADAQQQILQEPETQSVTVLLSVNPLGILSSTVQIKTKTGAIVELQGQQNDQGAMIFLP